MSVEASMSCASGLEQQCCVIFPDVRMAEPHSYVEDLRCLLECGRR
jgi:hypothetical protein